MIVVGKLFFEERVLEFFWPWYNIAWLYFPRVTLSDALYNVHFLWMDAIAVDIYYRQVYYILQKDQANVGIMSMMSIRIPSDTDTCLVYLWKVFLK